MQHFRAAYPTPTSKLYIRGSRGNVIRPYLLKHLKPGAFAEFETSLRRERQIEGIAKAKAEGRYKGRPVTVDKDMIRRLHGEGVKPTQIAQKLGVARSTDYEALKDAREA